MHETFTDHGMSGSRRDRPQLNKMMKAAQRGDFNIVVCFKADRLFRSLKNMLTTIDELDAMSVGFVSCTETFDTTTPQGKLMLSLIGAFGEFERGLIRERTKAGIAE